MPGHMRRSLLTPFQLPGALTSHAPCTKFHADVVDTQNVISMHEQKIYLLVIVSGREILNVL